MEKLQKIRALSVFLALFFSLSLSAAEEGSHSDPARESNVAGYSQRQNGKPQVFADVRKIMESALCGFGSEELRTSLAHLQGQVKHLPAATQRHYSKAVSQISNSFLKFWCHTSFQDDTQKFESCLQQLQGVWKVGDRDDGGKLAEEKSVLLSPSFPEDEFLSHLKEVKNDLIAKGAPVDCKVEYLVGPALPANKDQREVEHERITSSYVDALVDSISMDEDMRSELIWVHGARIARLLRQNRISIEGLDRRTKEVLSEKCQADQACIDRFLPKLSAINEYFWQGALAEEKENPNSPFYEQKIYALSEKEAAAIAVEMDHVMARQQAQANSKPNLLMAELSKAVEKEQAFAIKAELPDVEKGSSEAADHSQEDLLAKHWPSYEQPRKIPNKTKGIFEDKSFAKSVDSVTLSDDEKKLVAEFSRKTGLGVQAITKAFEARKKFDGSIRNSEELVVIDYTIAINKKRICILNIKTKAVRCDHVAHGRGKGSYMNSAGAGSKPKYFGNEKDYKLGTFGAHVTVGQKYWQSTSGRYQRTLRGLEAKVNDNAERDGKVFHKCSYASYGRSHGCISTDVGMDKALSAVPAGSLVYIYPGAVKKVGSKIKVPYASGDPDSGKYRQAEIWEVVGP